MIQFEEYYCFPADQVACVKATDGRDGYLLNVILKNGTDVGVTYANKKRRDDAKSSLVIRIERELEREDSKRELGREDSNHVLLLDKAIWAQRSLDRLDRRQQKILKLLNSGLGQKQEEV
ncbi:MAG: hypothetical protein IJL39_05145 [Clostridia bacterium]|nr:hypothetical protein [Clostridia bacterium]